MLRKAGHDVSLSIESLGVAAADSDVLAHARQEKRAVLTFDCADFSMLHEAAPDHQGMLVAYQDGDSRDMSYAEITSTIDRITTTHPGGVAGQFIVLDHHRGAR